MTIGLPAEPFFSIAFPAGWQVRFARHPMLIDARSPAGARIAAWACSISERNAATTVRRDTLNIELRRARVQALRIVDGKLGGEHALVALYDHDRRPHAQVSAVRDGIEYRLSMDTPSVDERDAALAMLAASFKFPTVAVAAEAKGTLPVALNAQESAFAEVARSKEVARAAMGYLPAAPAGGPGRKRTR